MVSVTPTSPSDHNTSHGACGKTWRQRGNRTGHCGACHETFEGETVFDAHRITDKQGNRVCLPPSEVKYAGVLLRLENGTWRGPKMSAEALARRKATV
ncbi:FDXHR family putative zinc-binding protein [Leucobacter chromiisoli]|uniref:FDXHR family putative zinc-binding protein n=1 Tax=Leucobacter chromiisoli TaxID=2796471 RepID=UPI003FD8C81B